MAYTSKIANELLVTPFDDKSNVSSVVSSRLTPEEFCDHCYCNPQFERETSYLNDELLTSDDILTKSEELVSRLYIQKTSNDNFTVWLNNFESDNEKVYTINGNAGTGKTTFINYKKHKDASAKWVILDVHLARSFDEWIPDIVTSVSHFEQAHSKVYAVIMNKLWELLFQGIDANNNFSIFQVYDTLSKLVENYKDRFANIFPSGRTLFDELVKIMDSEHEVYFKVEESAKLFQRYIDGNVNKNEDVVISILNTLLLTLRCLSDDNEEKYVIVFDNFERFIAKDELYNKDVNSIRSLLTSYVRRVNKLGNCNRNRVKFMLAVRDSTARMCGIRLHSSDSLSSDLDISGWYDTQNIINLKKQWYNQNQIPLTESDTVEQIIGDLRTCTDHSLTGLKLFIDPLFNDNKRLIVDFIGTMIEKPINAKWKRMYIALWNENTSRSRFMARSIIRGMILNELERLPDKLFEHLKTYNSHNENSGMGDARKILTILYNNIQSGNANEMPLSLVLSELFHVTDIQAIWNDEVYAKSVRSVSEILFYMNSYNRRENDWLQFIDIQIRNNSCSIIAEDSDKFKQLLGNNINNCFIHLMPGGRAYLMYIAASFEFFSLRYTKRYSPLFTLIPTPEEIMKYESTEVIPCYSVMKRVAIYAFKCIESLKHGEDTLKLHIGNSITGIYHYERIINQHISYISLFLTYVRDTYFTNEISICVKNKYEDLFLEIEALIDKYKSYKYKK